MRSKRSYPALVVVLCAIVMLSACAAATAIEEITFQSGDFTLAGDLQVPDGGGQHPVILMVHGDGGSDRYDWGKYRPIMVRFLRAGYAVFCWDKPGVGESTGALDRFTKSSQRAEILIDALERISQHPAVDRERIGLWGISQAGIVMPLALTMTDDIAFMIVASGPGMHTLDQGAYLEGQLHVCQGHSEEEGRFVEQYSAAAINTTSYEEYFESVTNLVQLGFRSEDSITPEDEWSPVRSRLPEVLLFNPIEVIEQTAIPVLAFFGELDKQVDPIQGAQAYEEALQKAGNQHSRVELLEGVNHVLVLARTGCLGEERPTVYPSRYLDLMEKWLEQLLDEPAGAGGGS